MTPVLPPTALLPLDAGAGEAAAPQATSALADKFGALMDDLRRIPAHDAGSGVTAIGSIANAGNAALQGLHDKMSNIAANSGTMTEAELKAAGLQVMLDTAMLQFQMHAGMGLVQSTKGAVQTLFRNQ